MNGAAELIAAHTDPGSWHSWDDAVNLAWMQPEYAATLATARAKAGTDEAVLTGRARIGGHDVALIVSEFRFLGGSIGVAAARRIVAAVRRATRERLPLIAAPASGGTRMQEGTPAFVAMIEISRAVVEHKNAGLPYLVYLRHPTTGGVLASWGSLGHVTVAEPGALIGFLGPAVYEALHGSPFPPGVQVAENLVRHGVIDAVVPADQLASAAARALTLLRGSEPAGHPHRILPVPVPGSGRDTDVDSDAWTSIQLTRRPDRPGVRELLSHAADDVIRLSGTPEGEAGDALTIFLTSFEGMSCVLVGQDRRSQSAHQPLGPAALRGARRGMAIAEELRRPLVCVIDTPGADLSAAAEEGALAGEIARCLAAMTRLTVPTVSVLLGQGCGGGALALLPSVRVIAAQHAWLSPLPPEGASVIMHGTAEHAPQMARAQQVRAHDLRRSGVVHTIVPERVPAHEDARGFALAMAAEIAQQIRAQVRVKLAQ